jgi:hypothetical protein
MSKHTTLLDNLLSPLSRSVFESQVTEYQGDKGVRTLTTHDMLKTIMFGQITAAMSGRDLDAILQANAARLYHNGLKPVKRTTLCDAMESRDFRIFEQTFEELVIMAEILAGQCGRRFKNPLKVIDSTTIDVCLNRYAWAHYKTTKGAIKLHTRIDADNQFPEKLILTDGTVHDVKIMDYLCDKSGVIYTMDKGYIDYNSWYTIALHDSWFVTRMKTNCVHEELSVFTEAATGKIRLDADILLTSEKGMREYPVVLRKVWYHDDETHRDYIFLTNNFEHTAQEIADIYKRRWQIELFFKWIKQNLNIKTFWGTSKNAVLIQIYVALILAVLLWIHRHVHGIPVSAHRIMQMLKTAILSQNTIFKLCQGADPPPKPADKQLFLEGLAC